MAARSPVLIESSPSGEAYEAPTITPDNVRPSGNTTSTTRSSPQLLSPSAFARPRVPLLKSGSRAQQVPVGATAGFASAVSFWKEQGNLEQAQGAIEDETRLASDREGEKRTSKTKGAGKLTRPKKAPRRRKTSISAIEGSESPRCDSFIDSKGNKAALPAQVLGPSRANEAAPHEATTISRRPSINISEYSFNADAAPEQPTVSVQGAPAVKKPTVRKRVGKTDDKAKTPAPKKPRKSKAKSEAIILDSDEPEIPLFDPESADKEVTATLAKKPRPKVVKKPAQSKAKTDATAAEVLKTTKRYDVPESATKESASAYFPQQEPSGDLDRLPSSPPPVQSAARQQVQDIALVDVYATVLATDASLLPIEPAQRRRRSWTPVKNYKAENVTNTIPVANHELNEHMERTSFSEMLGSFSFLQSETAPAPRAANGEASTKRRRVELSDVPQLAQSVDKPKAKATLKPVKAVKKPKAIPKKPQTITDRATEAYRPLKEADPEQPTISAHFTPRKEVEVATAAGGDGRDTEEVAAKIKKPRKSRAKVQPLEENAAITIKAKPKTKTTKVKVKFDTRDHQAPLRSPTQALNQMKAQDFLFGTSSQLAAEESPEFIREIQLAVRQSEEVFAMPNSSQIGTQLDLDSFGGGKSYASVPTAPHGTCLSVEQARRELWCVSARDETGSKLAQELMLPPYDALVTENEGHAGQTHDVITVSSSAHGNIEEKAGSFPEQTAPQQQISTVHANEVPEPVEDLNQVLPVQVQDTENDQPTLPESNAGVRGDDWMLLQSDDSLCLPQAASCPPPLQPIGLATSPARRTALRALDANIPLSGPEPLAKASSQIQMRPCSTTVPATERVRARKQPLAIDKDDGVQALISPKRGRGRPRKEPSLERPAQTSPARGRGRPRKDTSLERPAQTSPARGRGRPCKNSLLDKPAKTSPVEKTTLNDREAPASPKRPVGRPRKTAKQNDAPLPSSTETGGPANKESVSNTEPLRLFRKIPSPQSRGPASQQTPQKEWTNIDEISDFDSPTTPSPKRRRASSSPAFIRPLDFDMPQQEFPAPPKATGPVTAALKPTDAVWPAMQSALFPQITQTITSAPSGHQEDLKAPPSWHEKILLYDPIVLEDLTAWLNSQGLRTELERVKPKVKTRGRKKKDAPPEVEEWEVVRGELKAWMVQKWCEEKSVCCLWREGLRGGVKGRY